MTKQRAFRWVSVAVLVAALLGVTCAWLSTDGMLQRLQSVKYGTPARICTAGIQVLATGPWVIDLVISDAHSLPLLFGVLPIPRAWARVKGESPLIVLRSTSEHGSVSIHPIAQLSAEDVKTNCLNSSFCSIEKFGEGVEVVKVRAGDTTWITYLERPVMLGIHGDLNDRALEFEVSTCQ